MESLPENKAVRLLEIYTHLIKGDVLSKTELATQYIFPGEVSSGTWRPCGPSSLGCI